MRKIRDGEQPAAKSLTLSSNWLLWILTLRNFSRVFYVSRAFLFTALFYFPRNFECLARAEERRPLLLPLEPKGVDHPPEAQPPGRLPEAHHLNHNRDPQYPNYWMLIVTYTFPEKKKYHASILKGADFEFLTPVAIWSGHNTWKVV